MTYRAWLAPMLFYFLARGLVRNREDVRGLLLADGLHDPPHRAGRLQGGTGPLEPGQHRRRPRAGPDGAGQLDGRLPRVLRPPAPRPGRRCAVARGGPCPTSPDSSSSPGPRSTRSRARPTWPSPPARPRSCCSATRCSWPPPAGGGAVAMALFPSLIPASVKERLDETTTRSSVYEGDGATVALDKSSAHRLVIWRGAARMIAAHPAAGHRPRPVPAGDRELHGGAAQEERSPRRPQCLHPRRGGERPPHPRPPPAALRGLGAPRSPTAVPAPPSRRPQPGARLPRDPGRGGR